MSDVKWDGVFARVLVNRIPIPWSSPARGAPGGGLVSRCVKKEWEWGTPKHELLSYPYGPHSCVLPEIRIYSSTSFGELCLVTTMLRCIYGKTKQLARADVLALRFTDTFCRSVCLSVHIFVYTWV